MGIPQKNHPELLGLTQQPSQNNPAGLNHGTAGRQGAEGHSFHCSKTSGFLVQEITPKMFNIQLSDLRKSTELLPAPGMQRGSSLGWKDGHSAGQTSCLGLEQTPRRPFPRVQHAGNKRFLPGELQGDPSSTTCPAAPAIPVSSSATPQPQSCSSSCTGQPGQHPAGLAFLSSLYYLHYF